MIRSLSSQNSFMRTMFLLKVCSFYFTFLQHILVTSPLNSQTSFVRTNLPLKVCSSHLIVVAVALQDRPVQRPIQVAHSRAVPLAARDVGVRVSRIVQVDHKIVAGSRKLRPVGGVLEIVDAVGAVLPCE
jgi:hypothetical protein